MLQQQVHVHLDEAKCRDHIGTPHPFGRLSNPERLLAIWQVDHHHGASPIHMHVRRAVLTRCKKNPHLESINVKHRGHNGG